MSVTTADFIEIYSSPAEEVHSLALRINLCSVPSLSGKAVKSSAKMVSPSTVPFVVYRKESMIWYHARQPAEFKHVIKRMKRN